MTASSKRITLAGLALIMLLAFLAVSCSTVSYADSDPEVSLLVSEAILTQGTIKLDHYGDAITERYGYRIHEVNGHLYYYFPLGTSIAALPFVALASLSGLDMITYEHDLQKVIAAFTAALTVLVLFLIARIFLEPLYALIAAALFWFGTSYASTTGTALWGQNFASLFVLSSLYTAICMFKQEKPGLWPALTLLFFFAFLCRPTVALLAPFLLLFLFSHNRPIAIKTTLLFTVLLACFMFFSFYEFKQHLPTYYLPERLQNDDWTIAFYVNLFSPARGLFIFSPFLLFALFGIKIKGGRVDLKSAWLLIAVAWPLMHLFSISHFQHWWAGGSFGPRFMLDILPALYLLAINAWPVSIRGTFAKTSMFFLSAAALFSIYVNTVQGLFNDYTRIWNIEPNIDAHPEYILDWEYPQFLHNQARHEARLKRYEDHLTELKQEL